jgi:phage regulator Rha-like protein
MPKSSNKLTSDQLDRLIYEVRGERVMLDSDLALIYGVETKALNRAVKRNRDRFPKDFMFQLSEDEWKNLRYQIGTSSSNSKHQSLRYQIGTSTLGHGGRRSRPYVFTEHGAIMAANVLNSRRAVQMSVFVVRAFLKMRALLGDNRDLAQKLAALEKELKKRLDVHDTVIVTILQRVMDIIDPPALPPPPPKPHIGFTP